VTDGSSPHLSATSCTSSRFRFFAAEGNSDEAKCTGYVPLEGTEAVVDVDAMVDICPVSCDKIPGRLDAVWWSGFDLVQQERYKSRDCLDLCS